jgi:hypothetical protein
MSISGFYGKPIFVIGRCLERSEFVFGEEEMLMRFTATQIGNQLLLPVVGLHSNK